MDEFQLIETIKQKTYKQSSLIKGIGDDGAVIRELAHDLVVSVDTFVEGIHFTKETMNAFHVGYRLLAANFSDLAAMGAVPAYYLVSAVIPPTWHETELIEIFNGMKTMATTYRADLLGGDTVSGNELVLTVTVIGRVEQNSVRYRSDAQAGDIVFVTGTIGDSQAGLYCLQHDFRCEADDYFINRHRKPEPQIMFSRAIRPIKRVALNDISDGIASEANEIALASNQTLIIEEENIPVHPSFHVFPEKQQRSWKLAGGEDFQLLGTVAEKDWEQIQTIAKEQGTQVTAIGYVTEKGAFPVYLKKNNQSNVLEKTGYTHLK